MTPPNHIGFIVDGNRRWAKEHGLPTYEGHLAGYNALKDIVLETIAQGVKFVSLYTFSTENWQRAESEVSNLMKLMLRLFKTDLHILLDNNIRLLVLGSDDHLPEKVVKAARSAEEQTAHCTGGTVAVCFNYGGQQEIIHAAQAAIAAGASVEKLTTDDISAHLYHPEVPNVDVIVRTSGEQRLSNFMLWRAAYSELIFLPKYWPDMRESDVRDIIEEYDKRGRRFGK